MYVSRKAWGARPPAHKVPRLAPGHVKGLALHWPGMDSPLGTRPLVDQALRSWQDFHINGNKWSDIAYQAAVDQAGNWYGLRGLRNQSAANGDTDVNEEYGAVLLVLAIGERPTDAMVRTTRRVVKRHREFFTGSRLLVPHSEIRPEPTLCPGDHVRKLITTGAFE